MKEITFKEYCRLPDEIRKNFTGIVNWNEGGQSFLQNGKMHRTDGPAVIYANGHVKYWIDGTKTTKEGQEVYYNLHKLKGLI